MEEGKRVSLLKDEKYEDDEKLTRKIWEETKKLWVIIGPATFSLIALYTTFLVGQISAGRLGELELAAMALACNVIVGVDFGFMVYICPKSLCHHYAML